jgi:hypothetical protein
MFFVMEKACLVLLEEGFIGITYAAVPIVR